MATNRRTMPLPPDAIWDVLTDGFAYRDWVVGTRHIRAVEDGFPEPGKRLHYRVGWGPLRNEGHTTVTAADPGRHIELEVRAWPAAAVHVAIELTPRQSGMTEVTMTEYPSKGPAAVMHNPVSDGLLRLRNVETLRRLELVASRRRANGDQR